MVFVVVSVIFVIVEEWLVVGYCFCSYYNVFFNWIYVGCVFKGNMIGVDCIVVLDGFGVYLGSYVFDCLFMLVLVLLVFVVIFLLMVSGD